MSKIKFLAAGGLFYSEDGLSGNPCIGYRDVGTLDDLLVGEPYIIHTHSFRNKREKIKIKVDMNEVLSATGVTAFVVPVGKSYKVTAIDESHTVAESTAATLNLRVERCQGTEAVGAGDDLTTATGVNMKAAANTVITPTVQSGSGINILVAGDRLLVHASVDAETPTASTEYRGGLTISLEAQVDGMSPAVIFEASDKEYELVDVKASWGVAESTAAQCNLDIVKLATLKSSGAARGTGVEDVIVTTGATQVDLTGTADTVGSATLVTAASEEVLAVGDRLVVRFSDDAGTVVVPSELDELMVTVRLAPVTMGAVDA